jgi:hypothetical protein
MRNVLLLIFVLLFIGGPFQTPALDPDRSIYQQYYKWRLQ